MLLHTNLQARQSSSIKTSLYRLVLCLLPIIVIVMPISLAGCSEERTGQEKTTAENKNNTKTRKEANLSDPSEVLKQAELDLQNMATEDEPELLLRLEKTIKEILEKHPDFFDGYIFLARLYRTTEIPLFSEDYFTKKHELSLKMYERAIELKPKSAEAILGLAIVYQNTNKKNLAEKRALKAVAIEPSNPATLLEAGRCLYEVGSYEKAKSVFERVLSLLKTKRKSGQTTLEDKVKNLLGKTFMKMGEFEKAETYLMDSANEDGKKGWACAYQSLGELYSTMGSSKKAANSYMKLAEKIQGVPQYKYLAAVKCFEVGDFETALIYAKKAQKMKDKSEYRVLLGFLTLLEREYEKADKLFGSALKSESTAGAQIGKGHLALIKKDYKLAKKLLEDGYLSFNEGNISPGREDKEHLFWTMGLLGFGWLEANQGKHQQALHHFEKLLKFQPENLLALLGKANSLVALEQLDNAESIYNSILESNPENMYAMTELGVIYLKKGKHELAKKQFSQALEKDSERFTCPYEGMGLLFLKEGKYGEAKKYLRKAIDINPNIEYKKFNALAKIYIKESKLEKAGQLLKKSIENHPYDNEAKELLQSIDLEE